MTQREALESWWADLDELGRARVLRLEPDDKLFGDMRLGLSMAGVSVERVLGDVEAYVVPDVLLELIDEQRGL